MSVWAHHDDRDQAVGGRGEPARQLIDRRLGLRRHGVAGNRIERVDPDPFDQLTALERLVHVSVDATKLGDRPVKTLLFDV